MAESFVKILFEVTLDGTETIKWLEGVNVLETTLTPGPYYGHNDVEFDAEYPSLFRAIADAMDAESTANGLGQAYGFVEATPTDSSQMTNFGLKIISDGEFDWDTSGTINADGWLGFTTSDGVISANGIFEVYSTRTYSTSWICPEPPTLWGSHPERIVEASTEYVEREDAYWFDRGSRSIRELVFQYIPSAHIYKARANRAEYASTGQVAINDTFNALERVWESACVGGTLIMVWYDQRSDIDLDVNDNGYYEIARLQDRKNMQDFSTMISLRRTAGELYDVSFKTVRMNGTDYTWEQ